MCLKRISLLLASAFAAVGCTTMEPNANGVAPQSFDPTVRGPIAGIGIEAYDVSSMTDQMVRDLLSSPAIARRSASPRIQMDVSDFKNESSQAINRNLIVDRMRVGLNRSAGGRLMFVSREHIQSVNLEREAKRQGLTDTGTTGLTQATAGVDYKLVGRIAALDSRSSRTGVQQRYTQITFEMLDMESSAVVWNNQYEIARAGADDVVYR